jgi:phosphopantothenate-cysteine ligase
MAVSDYRVKTVTTPALVAASLAEALAGAEGKYYGDLCAAALERAASLKRDEKISSREKNLILFLESTPKIISLFRELAPRALLVGFKLLDHVPHERLMEAARELLEQYRCAFVVANDARDIHGDTHRAYLVGQDTARRYETKEEIAGGIAERLIAAL